MFWSFSPLISQLILTVGSCGPVFRAGNIAKIIAKSLSELGFKNTWVVADGYDGGKGWVQSKLGSESYKSSFGDILSPSRVIPPGTHVLTSWDYRTMNYLINESWLLGLLMESLHMNNIL